MSVETDTAWAAGLFEGEGCITFVGVNSVALFVRMTDLDVIERLHSIFDVGHVERPVTFSPASRRKQMHGWGCSAKGDVLSVLDRIQPHLGERRAAKAQEARVRLSGCRDHGFCKRGHAIEGANRYESPGGQVQCRECIGIRAKARGPRIIKT